MASGVSPSMALALAGFCFCLIFIAFVCSRLACAILRRRRRRVRSRHYAADHYYPPFAAVHHHPAPAGAAAVGLGLGLGLGLGPAAVAALPTRAFSARSGADSQCVICLAEYEGKDVLRILPRCGHDFHMACVDLWLEQSSTCPVCRISLLDSPDIDHTAATATAAAAVPPPPVPSNSIVISLPSSPEPSGSDPCRCLFGSTAGHHHSSRASEAPPPRHEPDQENQLPSTGGTSVDGTNTDHSMPLPEANPAAPDSNNGQTARKQVM